MGLTLLLLIVAIAAGGFWYLRQAAKRSRESSTARLTAAGSISAVAKDPRRPGRMLNPGQECCGAAKRIESHWYPEGEMPHLPLESCEHPESCKCGWMRVLDRRSTHRRSEHDRRQALRFEDKDDRRSGNDRRRDAGNPWKHN